MDFERAAREVGQACVCPSCHATLSLAKDRNSLQCSHCDKSYPIKDSLFVLVRDLDALQQKLEGVTEKRKGWYTSEQIKNFEQGPYRHHLRKRVLYLKDFARRHKLEKGKHILDAGCGDGINLKHYLSCSPNTVFGMDFNFLRLQRAGANAKNQAILILGDLLNPPFQNDYFDIILLNHVLEHIPEDREVLAQLYRCLKPGGTLMLGVPNEGALLWQLQYHVLERRLQSTTDHVNFYTVKKLKKLVGEVGFTVVEVKRMGYGVPHSRIDALLRNFKFMDDLFDVVGHLVPSQCTSLYMMLRK